MKEATLKTPITTEQVRDLDIGDIVYLSGTVFTARDMAHLKLKRLLAAGEKLPEEFEGGIIFHAGPVVKKTSDGWQLWVIGPTTSIRMEPYADMVGKMGVKAIVGKGGMAEGTSAALGKYGGIYLLAAPGCGVVHSQAVREVRRVHWLEEFGVPEAIWVLDVEKWGPHVVGMDYKGRSIFKDIATRANSLKKTWFAAVD